MVAHRNALPSHKSCHIWAQGSIERVTNVTMTPVFKDSEGNPSISSLHLLFRTWQASMQEHRTRCLRSPMQYGPRTYVMVSSPILCSAIL